MLEASRLCGLCRAPGEAGRRRRYTGIGVANGIKGSGPWPVRNRPSSASVNQARYRFTRGAAPMGQGTETCLPRFAPEQFGCHARRHQRRRRRHRNGAARHGWLRQPANRHRRFVGPPCRSPGTRKGSAKSPVHLLEASVEDFVSARMAGSRSKASTRPRRIVSRDGDGRLWLAGLCHPRRPEPQAWSRPKISCPRG